MALIDLKFNVIDHSSLPPLVPSMQFLQMSIGEGEVRKKILKFFAVA